MTHIFAIFLASLVPVSYQGTVSINPEENSLQVQLNITVKNDDPAPAAVIPFRFRTDFTTLLVADEQGRLEWKWSDDRFQVQLRNPLPPQDTATIRILYVGVVKNLPWDFITSDGVVLRGEEARWYPFLRRFFKSDVEVQVPEGWTVRATGELKAGRFVAAAAPSILILAAPDRVEHEKGAVTLYTSRKNTAAAPGILAVAEKSVALFSELFGPPPTGHLVLFEVPGFAGGYANQGLVLVNPKMVESFHSDAPEECWLAHEICHQWWGNLIFGHAWLLEGLSRYAELIYVERFYDPATVAARLSKYQEIADRAQPGLTIRDTNWLYQEDYFRVTYNRGALVHHRLREWLGDQAYFSLLRSLLEENHFREVTLDDFFEAVCKLKPRAEVKAFYYHFISSDFDVYTGEPRSAFMVMSLWMAVVFAVLILLVQAVLDVILLRKTSPGYRRLFRHPPYLIASGLMGAAIAAEVVLGPTWVWTYFTLGGMVLCGFAFGVRFNVHRQGNPARWSWAYLSHFATYAGMALVVNAFWSLLVVLVAGVPVFLWKPVR